MISLLIICIGAFLCPVLSSLLPKKIIPETVFFLIVGVIVGPHVLGIVNVGDAIELLSELGLAFLFLLAGYEIEPSELSGKGGRHGLATWFISFSVALAITIPIGISRGSIIGAFAVGIILTTTAFGTLVPILKDRHLSSTPIGRSVVEYGVWGELCPVLAMALLLTTRGTLTTIILLSAFLIIAIVSALVSKRLRRQGSKIEKLISDNAETNSQLNMRFVVMLLVVLVAVSAIFDLDIVLGAFAAGFVLRIAIPDGDKLLETKLNGLSYGFFIPLFFIVSGTKINPSSVLDEPFLFALFIVSLLLIRAVPIYVSLKLRKDTRYMTRGIRATIALYCTTALPLIVAVTAVMTSAGAMSQETASVLVSAGGTTVLLMPLFAHLVLKPTESKLGSVADEIYNDPEHTMNILKEHDIIDEECDDNGVCVYVSKNDSAKS